MISDGWTKASMRDCPNQRFIVVQRNQISFDVHTDAHIVWRQMHLLSIFEASKSWPILPLVSLIWKHSLHVATYHFLSVGFFEK